MCDIPKRSFMVKASLVSDKEAIDYAVRPSALPASASSSNSGWRRSPSTGHNSALPPPVHPAQQTDRAPSCLTNAADTDPVPRSAHQNCYSASSNARSYRQRAAGFLPAASRICSRAKSSAPMPRLCEPGTTAVAPFSAVNSCSAISDCDHMKAGIDADRKLPCHAGPRG